ncbi:MAG: hypothetical protein ABI858_02175 [Pseudoxanthomonas sp.]
MSTLYITEFASQGRDAAGYQVQDIPVYPPAAEQVVAIGAGSVQSAALQPSTTLVTVASDQACSIAVGANPTATATNRRIAANVPVQICVPVKSGFKIAVITNT